MPRKYVRKTNGPAYTKKDLINAVTDVQNHNKTYRQAQEYYNVPIAVISQRINGRKTSIDSTGPGRKTALSAQLEDKVVECLLARAKAGYPCDKEELLNLIQEYVQSHTLTTPFVNGRPGEDWYYLFLRRHNGILSLKKPEQLQKCRKEARKPDIIYKFYDDLRQTLSDLDIESEEKGGFIYNADETGFKSDPSRLRAIGEKGKPLSRVSGGSGRESTTVLACVGADGSFLPPLIVFKGAGIQARWTSQQAYPGTLYTVSKNGWMEEPQFFTWFTKSFIPHVNIIRQEKSLPNQGAVLLYDGHSSHISVRIIEAAIENKITLIKLPSHLTDMLQPLDKCVFGPVKTCWEKKLISFGKRQMGKGTGSLSKSDFVEMLGEVWSVALKKSNIIAGFKSCGIFPADKTKFPKDAFKREELEVYLQNHPDPPLEPQKRLLGTDNRNDSLLQKNIVSSETRNQQKANEEKDPREDVLTPHKIPEKGNNQCSHLHTETCTSACPSNIFLETNLDTNILPSTKTSETSLKKIFFKSPEKKETTTIVESTQSSSKKIVIPRLKQLSYGEVLTTADVLKRLKEAQQKKLVKTKKEKLDTTLPKTTERPKKRLNKPEKKKKK